MPSDQDPERRAAEARIGRVIGGKWQLTGVLGIGGMAAVYAARARDGAVAAVKVLDPNVGKLADIRHRFAQEGTAAARVGHPGVVTVLGSGEDPDGTAYLVMELLEGETLGAVLRREGGLEVPRLLDVMIQVLEVLAAAHERGIVHRDLKPDNLFVTAGDRIKVLDFGVARVLEDVPGAYRTRAGVTLGTVPFMSPEQALGKRAQVDGRSDLFSLGAMAFRILARRNVHEAETDAEMLVCMASKPAPPLRTVAPQVQPGLASVVDVALAFSKESRYPDARTMRDDVRACAVGILPPYATRTLRARDMATRMDVAPPPSTVGAPLLQTVREGPPEPAASLAGGVPGSLPLSRTIPEPVGSMQIVAPASLPLSRTVPDSAITQSRPDVPLGSTLPSSLDAPLDLSVKYSESLGSTLQSPLEAAAPLSATLRAVDAPPPSSRRVMSMAAVPVDVAPGTQRAGEGPAWASAPVGVGATLASIEHRAAGKAGPDASRTRPLLVVAGIVLLLASAAAGYLLARPGAGNTPPGAPAAPSR